jgi:electron transfer flavoprotein alpha subunit
MKNKKVVIALKYYKGEINPFDGAALEAALEVGFTDITVLAMAPMSVMPALTSITRLGVEAILVSDPLFAGSDTIATSYILSEVIRRLDPDLVFCGRQSIDGDTAQVPPMLAQRLGFALSSKVVEILPTSDFKTRTGEFVDLNSKRVVTFERMRTLRFPSMFSKPRTVTLITNSDLCLTPERVGLAGSPTRVIKAYESTVGRRNCKFISKDELKDTVIRSLSRERKEIFSASSEKLDRICFFGNIRPLAESIANDAIGIEYDGRDIREIADRLKTEGARVVLFEGNDRLKELAARLAVLCEAGICADCISFRVDDGKFVMTRPAGGGNITADIVSVSDMAFATVKTADTKGAEVIFSVGKGAVSNIDRIRELSAEYNAELCASRIVVDSGKMPYSSQVGLTGKSVAPAVYVAFGISGAVQHTVGISGARTVIAINNDKNAPIFDYADFGIIADINEF